MEEPARSEDCAEVCEFLSFMKVKADGKPMDFQRLMITRCQREFEQKLKADLEASERQERNRRSVGNIRLIGELYNQCMLTDRIMHEIIRKLLGVSDEETLECLYWVLITSGKNLEESTKKKFASQSNIDPITRQSTLGLEPFDQYFAKIDEIVKTKE